MTFAASLGWTLFRAAIVVLVLGPLCPLLARWAHVSRWHWAVIAAPFVFPELLVGYAYAPWVAGRPWLAEIACAVLLGLRTLPAAVVAWELSPAGPVTRSALYCQHLAARSPTRGVPSRNFANAVDLAALYVAGPVRRALPAAVLFLLIAFQEFELAAILRATSWTDWLFAGLAQGMDLSESLRAAFWPGVLELTVLMSILAVIRRESGNDLAGDESLQQGSTTGAVAYVIVAWLLVIAFPAAQLVSGLPTGLWQLAMQPMRMLGLAKEIVVGLSASVLATALAWSVVGRLQHWIHDKSILSSVALCLLCVPGCLGSLVLSLAVLALFQRDRLAFLYDTPIPWLVGLTLFLLPRAMVLQAWAGASRRSSTFLAHQLLQSPDPHHYRRAGRLLWEMQGEPRFFAFGLLVYWAYLELTLGYLLRPSGMTSGVVRLYNFMHFGRSSALSAEAAVLLLIPLLGMWCLWMFQRWRVNRKIASGICAA